MLLRDWIKLKLATNLPTGQAGFQ